MNIFKLFRHKKISLELKTALVLASVSSSYTLGYCYNKNIISSREMSLILQARRYLEASLSSVSAGKVE
jgi:hypothetical protein